MSPLKASVLRRALAAAEWALSILLAPFLPAAKHPTAEDRRIGFLEVNRLGDLELALPALQRLRFHFPKARLVLIASSSLMDLVRGHPAIDEYVPLDVPWMNHRGKYNPLRYSAFWTQLQNLRRMKLDACLDTRGDLRRHLLMVLARIPERVSYDRFLGGENKGYRGRLLTHAIPHPLKPMHRIEENVYLIDQWAGQSGPALIPKTARLPPTDRAIRIAMHIESNWPNKMWEDDKWLAVMKSLNQQSRVSFHLFSASSVAAKTFSEKSRAQGIGVEVVCAPINELRSRLSAMDVYLGVDSGPMHVADTVGCRIISLFGPSDITVWHAYNNGISSALSQQVACPYAPCKKPSCQTLDTRCMTSISPSQVLTACEPIFQNLASSTSQRIE
jgi:ADP-heptose:LPS heptosyltransferase